MKKNKKGFTLVELLAVIVILGLLMAIAIPSVTKYITQSRIKTLTTTMDSYITAVITQVNDGEYKFSDSTKVFAIPIECVALEKGGTNPFGNWMQANSAYWAYVLVHYDNENYNYQYGFTFKDDAGYGLYPTINDKITNNMIKTGYDDLIQPKDGLAKDFVPVSKWEGFTNINNSTTLIVLEAESEGKTGDGYNTCTLCQKGDNYDTIEQDKIKTLKIDTETYKFEKGMTWRDWLSSSYNTGGYYISNDGSSIFVRIPTKGDLTHTFIVEYDCIVTRTSLEEELKDTYYTYGMVLLDDFILENIHYNLREGGYSTMIYDSEEGYWEDHYLKRESDGSLTYIKIK